MKVKTSRENQPDLVLQRNEQRSNELEKFASTLTKTSDAISSHASSNGTLISSVSMTICI